ncbi:MAG: site-specific DNA-methyltransferase [Tissierellia bacterium]|nr:site-specific DNA-methyltransferase [Tissierellia bacterium]
MKSELNKTIDFPLSEAKEYLKQAINEKDLGNLRFSDLINKNIIGNFFHAIDFIEDESIDLIIVDPPYNLRKDYHGNIFNETTKNEYETYTRAWLEKLVPKLKKDGSIYICCDWKSSMVIGRTLADYVIVRNRITWKREKGRGSKTNWKNSMEDIWFATKSNDYVFNIDDVMIRKRVIAPYKKDGMPKDWQDSEEGKYRDTHPSNFWEDITIPFWSMKENTDNPTQKTEKLISRLILAGSNEGDLVLDPFLGSGTTSVVAKKLNRNFIGIEQNELYVAWAQKRLEMADEDPTIQGFEGGIYRERNFRL